MEDKKIFTRERTRIGLIASVWILAGVTLCLVVAVAVAVRQERNTRNMLMYQYDRALSDMSDAVATSEQFLLKAMASNSAKHTAHMLQEAARASAYAEGSMALLPLDSKTCEKISNYLVQVDDLAKVWAAAAIEDELKSSQVNLEDGSVEASSDGEKKNGWAGFTKENYALLQDLHGYSLDLSAALSELAVRVTENSHRWKDVAKDAKELLSDPFQDYPTVEYDGKFSDHMKNLQAKGLSGQVMGRQQSGQQIEQLFKKIFGGSPKVTFTGENTLNGIDLYCYEVVFQNGDQEKAFVTVTKQGGVLCDMVFHGKEQGGTLSQEQCEAAGQAFLKALNLKSMELVRTDMNQAEALLTFCYIDNGVYCYPDKVKVKVSCATGVVTGYDAYSYLMNHCVREQAEQGVPVVSQNQAIDSIHPNLTVVQVRECYLENGYGGEDHFYEFHCTGLGHKFLIYIDAEEGTEERIEILE